MKRIWATHLGEDVSTHSLRHTTGSVGATHESLREQ